MTTFFLGPISLHLHLPVEDRGQRHSTTNPTFEKREMLKAQAWEQFQQLVSRNNKSSWVHPSLDPTLLAEINQLVPRLEKASALIQIGMGGSVLGAKALVEMSSSQQKKHDRPIFFLDNLDTHQLHQVWEQIDWSDPLFFVVSKSGTTLETLAIMTLCLEQLSQRKKLSPDELIKHHVIVATDPEQGPLRAMAKRANIAALTIPPSVGGRYSVLTSVGLVAAAYQKLNWKQLIEGAQQVLQAPSLESLKLWSDFLLDHYYVGSKTETVLMPYLSGFKSFTAWFVQLWAESLGKDQQGLTPIAALGPADQHSQLQLFLEGPANKVTIFMTCPEHHQTKLSYAHSLGRWYDEHHLTYKNPWKALAPLTAEQIVDAQVKGTMLSFRDVQRPYCELQLSHLDEVNLGACFHAFMLLTSLVGFGLNIDPFGQPAVEAGKRHTLTILSPAPS